jgi:hypothetical protein
LKAVGRQIYFFLFGFWVNVLAAAAFDAALVRPSRSTCDAAFATEGDVVLPACR